MTTTFGLTGGIACGKSTVARLYSQWGVPVLDADQVARQVVEPGSDGLEKLRGAFGDAILLPDGQLDRAKLGQLVFGNEDKRRTLNGILHPLIGMRTQELIGEFAAQQEPLVCYEAALLVENGVADLFRPLVVVTLPKELQRARGLARGGIEQAELDARIGSQMPLADKAAAADFVIENSADLAALKTKAAEVLQAICKRQKVDPARYNIGLG